MHHFVLAKLATSSIRVKRSPGYIESGLSVMSLGDMRRRALVFVNIMEDVAQAQNAPLEWFLSTPGLGVFASAYEHFQNK